MKTSLLLSMQEDHSCVPLLTDRREVSVYDGLERTPYVDDTGEEFILMGDNARPQRAKLVEEYLEDQGLERMDWPTQSLDLNPIKRLRDYLGSQVAASSLPARFW
ncbi:hypothetical protein AVEN_128063-1 [Araneus ventricosus]|uniref:Tc1-like transposase DDE domain-containing protein n=1 Tax=Araneus ventricosus TaxID=182803 RepID=A0A4Y1ZZZ3_ARAVE|nr:hypothetical protein AVEN_128063-1 [Araneus ventricosus]